MSEENLRERIEAARKRQGLGSQPSDTHRSAGALGAAMFHAGQLVASVLVGLAIGFAIDKFADTGPWGLLIFLVFGMAAGFRSIFQSAKIMTQRAMEDAERQKRGTAPGTDDRSPSGD